jgi:hypothetical protein
MVRHRASSEEAARILSTDLAKAAALHVRLAKIASDAEAARREAELESPKATLAASTLSSKLILRRCALPSPKSDPQIGDHGWCRPRGRTIRQVSYSDTR